MNERRCKMERWKDVKDAFEVTRLSVFTRAFSKIRCFHSPVKCDGWMVL